MENKKITEEKEKKKDLLYLVVGVVLILLITAYMNIGVFFVAMTVPPSFGLFGSLAYSSVLTTITGIWIFLLLLTVYSKGRKKK